MRSGSVRSCPRQLPPHLEMTLVYCSRDFSTLRSLYPRQYWSLTTEVGAARDSYECKYIPSCMLLCHTAYYCSCFVFFCRRFWRFFTICFLSPSCVVRCFHPQFICLQSFILSLGPCLHPMCLAQDTSLYLCCQFHAQFRFVLARFKFYFFRFVVVHSSQVHLVWSPPPKACSRCFQ